MRSIKYFLPLLTMALFATVAPAQMIFSATDRKQDDRLDAHASHITVLYQNDEQIASALRRIEKKLDAAAQPVKGFEISDEDVSSITGIHSGEGRHPVVRKTKEVTVPVSTVPLSSPPVTAYVQSQVQPTIAHGTYQGGPEWSYPGDIANHLMGPNHNFSQSQLVGLSKAELEAMHSADHEGQRTVRSFQANTPSYQQGGCPGGVCPMQGPSGNNRVTQRSRQGWYPGKLLGF